MPRSAATCARGRPLSSANLTARASNSSGYFLGLDMTAEDLLSPGQHPGSEVPAKPGPAHPAHIEAVGCREVVGEVGQGTRVAEFVIPRQVIRVVRAGRPVIPD